MHNLFSVAPPCSGRPPCCGPLPSVQPPTNARPFVCRASLFQMTTLHSPLPSAQPPADAQPFVCRTPLLRHNRFPWLTGYSLLNHLPFNWIWPSLVDPLAFFSLKLNPTSCQNGPHISKKWYQMINKKRKSNFFLWSIDIRSINKNACKENDTVWKSTLWLKK